MAKVTSKFQVTVPKALADRYGIRPGDQIDLVAAGDVIRVIPGHPSDAVDDRAYRLRLFDQATERHRKRPRQSRNGMPRSRGWKREDLHQRGIAR